MRGHRHGGLMHPPIRLREGGGIKKSWRRKATWIAGHRTALAHVDGALVGTRLPVVLVRVALRVLQILALVRLLDICDRQKFLVCLLDSLLVPCCDAIEDRVLGGDSLGLLLQS